MRYPINLYSGLARKSSRSFFTTTSSYILSEWSSKSRFDPQIQFGQKKRLGNWGNSVQRKLSHLTFTVSLFASWIASQLLSWKTCYRFEWHDFVGVDLRRSCQRVFQSDTFGFKPRQSGRAIYSIVAPSHAWNRTCQIEWAYRAHAFAFLLRALAFSACPILNTFVSFWSSQPI